MFDRCHFYLIKQQQQQQQQQQAEINPKPLVAKANRGGLKESSQTEEREKSKTPRYTVEFSITNATTHY